MDSEFERRWRKGHSPFDGLTLTSRDYVPLPLLRQELACVVERLHKDNPDTALLRLSDWHEHDGFMSIAEPASWQELQSLLLSDVMLRAVCTGDTNVRTNFFPIKRDWCLRLYIPDDCDNPFYSHDDPNPVQYGIFDVTCRAPLAEEIENSLREILVNNLDVIPAKDFFDRSYGG